MSYELISEKDIPCPCKKSTYKVRCFQNDWMQHREEWDMNCDSCKSKYRLGSRATNKLESPTYFSWELI